MLARQINKPFLLKGFQTSVKNVAKRYLPRAATIGIQQTIRPLRRAKLRVESAIHPERFLADPFPPTHLHYVRPEEINHWGRRPQAMFSTWSDRGRVVGGDWDLHINDLRIDQTSFYTSYEARVRTGIEWRDTLYYQQVIKKIQAGETQWNCRNEKELQAKCDEWDDVFNSIRTHGYSAKKAPDEISVNIDRNGRLLLNDGYHRLVFCKLLGLQQIPVNVIVRHREWHDFRREIYEFAQSGRHSQRGVVYAPLLHMDLQSVPSQHGHDRFEIIRNNVCGKKILDIGAHLGYFCHRFEELRYECVAVESHPDISYFLRKLHAAQERQFRIVEESIFSFVERERPIVDTVLALSIFHHFIKEKFLYGRLIEMLAALKTKVIIFEPHCPAEPQMRGAFRNFNSETFVKFILDHSSMTQAEKIGVAQDGREIFRLS
jgi:hypothetical protein